MIEPKHTQGGIARYVEKFSYSKKILNSINTTNKLKAINEMSKMRSYKINGNRVEEVTGTLESKETTMLEVRPLLHNKGSTTRRKAKACRSDSTQEEQQWPFPTKVLEHMGRPLKFNPDNFERALF